MEFKDQDWLWLFLLLLFSKPNIREQLEKENKQEALKKFTQEHCTCIEWWDDMNARIPFCKRTGKPCGMECVERAANILIENPEICKCMEEE